MLWHDLGLAWASLRRSPLLTALMALTLSVGICCALIATTLYHSRAGHPIPWKDDTLYAVTLDSRGKEKPMNPVPHPEYPPFQLSYPDARALYASDIPLRAVMMFRSGLLLTPDKEGMRPFQVSLRVTTADFFGTFSVPLTYGSSWTRAEDDIPAAVVVLSRSLNQKLFGGANSVGREVVLQGRPFRVIGVLAAWMPQPRYYDLNGYTFQTPEDAYIPFGWFQAAHLNPQGSISCDGPAMGGDALRTPSCTWMQYWVETRNRADRDRFQAFVDRYTDEQRKHGRFPRPNNNRIVNVPTWLAMWDVVGDDSRMELLLGYVFLAMCVLNTIGLLLAKFLGSAPVSGLRRALGARRSDIVRVHLLEGMLLALIGGVLGLLLTYGGLALVRGVVNPVLLSFSDNPDQVALAQALTHVDLTMLGVALLVSLLSGLLAGLYPAWRIGRLEPASFLKAW